MNPFVVLVVAELRKHKDGDACTMAERHQNALARTRERCNVIHNLAVSIRILDSSMIEIKQMR